MRNSPEQTTLKSLVGQQEGLRGAKVKVSEPSVYLPGPGLDGEGQVLGCVVYAATPRPTARTTRECRGREGHSRVRGRERPDSV